MLLTAAAAENKEKHGSAQTTAGVCAAAYG